MFFAGDFAGAPELLVLTMMGNSIVSIDVEAFGDLKALRVNADDFNPTDELGKPYRDLFGLRTCSPPPCPDG